MKKNFLLAAVLSLTIAATSFAQVSTTPEVPRNYKPQPKELAPMPGELTDEMIFPVLGKYDYVNKEEKVASVTVTRDAENKGVVWINGMPQGKFKADLKQSPSTYKIPEQKPYKTTRQPANRQKPQMRLLPKKRSLGFLVNHLKRVR
ncbi:hypothetical protein KRR40_02465 [Niabella defluvii]|nr:hypothetical protein KRR40_02465 [Niabella sp. I65]